MSSSAAAVPGHARYAQRNQAPPQSTAITVTAGSGAESNPYVHVTPASESPSPCKTILKALERYGKRLEDGTRKAADATGNIWHHLRTGPNLADATVARLAQGTKVFAEGGHDKVFLQTFGAIPEEQLRKAYACYLSTSTGPVIGTLYLSTARLAFCSDSPLCYLNPNGQTEGMYYKVVVPLNQLKSVTPSASMWNPADRYIQITTVDNHDFWFMGFVSYDKALKHLCEALQQRDAHHYHHTKPCSDDAPLARCGRPVTNAREVWQVVDARMRGVVGQTRPPGAGSIGRQRSTTGEAGRRRSAAAGAEIGWTL